VKKKTRNFQNIQKASVMLGGDLSATSKTFASPKT
jgi:hypothetical protein